MIIFACSYVCLTARILIPRELDGHMREVVKLPAERMGRSLRELVTVLYFYKFGPPEYYMLHASRFIRNRIVEGCAALQRMLRQSERPSRGVLAKPAQSTGATFKFAVRILCVTVNLLNFVSQRGVTCYKLWPVKVQYTTVNNMHKFCLYSNTT